MSAGLCGRCGAPLGDSEDCEYCGTHTADLKEPRPVEFHPDRLGKLRCLGIALIVALLLAGSGGMVAISNGARMAPAAAPQAVAGTPPSQPPTATPLSTTTPAGPIAAALPTLTPSPTPVIVVVVNTEGLGVRFRQSPGGPVAKIWPENSPMRIIGQDREAAGQKWRQVQAPDGNEGWVAAAYLSEPAPTPPPDKAPGHTLELLASNSKPQHGYMTVDGQVKNVSAVSLKDVTAVAQWKTPNGNVIVSQSAPIDLNPLHPGRTSTFRVVTTLYPDMASYTITFKELLGRTISTLDSRRATTQTPRAMHASPIHVHPT